MARTHATRQVAAEQHQQLIAEHGATLLVHRADAIAVAVEGDPSSACRAGPSPADREDSRRRWDRDDDWGTCRRTDRTGDNLGAQTLQRVHRDDARDSIAAIHHRFHRAWQRAVALHDRVSIPRQHRAVLTAPATGPAGRTSLFDETPETLDVRAGNRLATEHALEAV